MTEVNNFLYPLRSSRGPAEPRRMIFDANLQEFSQRVSYIAGLETSGKLSPDESYRAIESLWQTLARSHSQLG